MNAPPIPTAAAAHQRVERLARQVMGALGIAGDADAFLGRFLRSFDCRPAAGDAPVATIVSDSGIPFEFSFSGGGPRPCLRLLGEAVEPGESLVSRCLRNVATAATVAGEFGLGDGAASVRRALETLLPAGEVMAELEWKAAIWTGMRTDGTRVSCRTYVNLQRRQSGHRLAQVRQCLQSLGDTASEDRLVELAPLLDGWAEAIGLSLDFTPDGIRPSRLHIDPGRLPIRRLLTLLGHCSAAARDTVVRFLELFDGPLPNDGSRPLLLSLGLWPGDASLKLDMFVRSVGLGRDRDLALLERAEAIAGPVDEYRQVQDLFRRADGFSGIQYIGLTVSPRSDPYLNIYLAPPPAESSPAPVEPSKRREAGLAFVVEQMSANGAFLMDARGKAFELRHVPGGWHDVYVSALVSQEARQLRNGPGQEFFSNIADWLHRAGQCGQWRYLPDLPYDVDDTAIALAALSDGGEAPRDSCLASLVQAQSADGGFVTFYGPADVQASHPAVTINASQLLNRHRVRWNESASRAYLLDWIAGDEFPRCPWSFSGLLPMFLLARSTALRAWLDTYSMARLHGWLSAAARADSTYGKGHSEALETALAVLCHALLGLPLPQPQSLADFLLRQQLPDGGWCWAPLFSDGNGTWFGHRAATTVIVLRALDQLPSAHLG